MSAYFFAKIICEIPLQIISPTIFVIISYWMVGLRKEAGPFFLFLAIMLAANLAASGAGLIISAVVTNLRIATVTSTVVVLLLYVHRLVLTIRAPIQAN
jgi:ABC-type multidrug transport system permease subunit